MIRYFSIDWILFCMLEGDLVYIFRGSIIMQLYFDKDVKKLLLMLLVGYKYIIY